MKSSCVRHPESEPLIIIRQWQLDFCGGNTAAAALLSFFEYWHNIKMEMSQKNKKLVEVANAHGETIEIDTSLYQWHTADDLARGIMGIATSKNTIRDALALLTEKKVISVHSNPNQKYKFDHTKYFIFYPQVVNDFLNNRSVSFDTSLVKIDQPSVENDPLSVKNDQTITETTTEITTEKNTPAKKTKDYLSDIVSSIGQVNEDTAPIPEDQWLHYRDAAYESFKNISGALGNNSAERQTRRGLIVGGVAARPDFDIERFERCMTEWIGATGRGENITKIWEVYDAGSYKAYIEKNYPKNQQQNSAPAPRARAYSKEQLEMIERLNKETEMERWRP